MPGNIPPFLSFFHRFFFLLLRGNYLLLFAFLFSITSCSKLYFKIIGIKEIKPVTKAQIDSYTKTLDLKASPLLELDSVKYKQLIRTKMNDTTHYTNPRWWVQNHIQPTQVVYYNKYTNKPVAAYFNCIAESRNIGNFTYNKFNELEFFPPLTYDDPKWVDTLFSYQEIVNTFNEMGIGTSYHFKDDGTKYLVLVFYSLAFEKQSSNIIHEANYHINNCIKDSSQVLYINMDNYLYYETLR